MLNFVTFAMFAGALALSMYTMIATIAPALDQIRAALLGEQRSFTPLATLVRAERRIAVRRWAATPARSTSVLRAAA